MENIFKLVIHDCPTCKQEIPEASEYYFDDKSNKVYSPSGEIKLTKKRYQITRFLAEKYPDVTSKGDLYDAVYDLSLDTGLPELDTLDVIIHQTKKKLREIDIDIKTHRGRGYRILPEFFDAWKPVPKNFLKRQEELPISICPTCSVDLPESSELLLDYTTGWVMVNGLATYLRKLNFEVLEYLSINTPEAVKREVIYEGIYALRPYSDYPGINIIETLIYQNRRALEKMGIEIKAPWNQGYSLHVGTPK